MIFARSLFVAALLMPHVAQAQSSPFLLPAGSRVKLEYGDSVRQVPIGFNRHRLIGALVADSSGAYRLRLPTGDMASVRHTGVTKAWVSHGVSRKRSALSLGLSFAMTGFFVGGGGTKTNARRQRDQLIGIGVGAGVGTIVGIIRPFETWRRVRR